VDESELYVVNTPAKHIRRFTVDIEKLTGGNVSASRCPTPVAPYVRPVQRHAHASAAGVQSPGTEARCRAGTA
jgi:hypothetical protein